MPRRGELFYSAVARGPIILAEHNATQGNIGQIVVDLLQNVEPREDQRLSFSVDGHHIHILSKGRFSFLCAAPEEFPRQVCFALLEDTSAIFMQDYGETGSKALAYELDMDFRSTLEEKMRYYNDPNVDRLSRVQQEVESLREVMVSNIENVLERGERLELLVDKTEGLDQNVVLFKTSATKLKQSMWWKEKRAKAAMFLLGLLIIYLLASTLCGFKLQC